VILRGSGFSSIASLTSRVNMPGGTLTNAVLVNDTEVVAYFAALSAGPYTVNVSDALGVQTHTGHVVAVDAPSYTYTAIATGGSLRTLAYDPERDSLYAANTGTGEIMSFHHSGSSWTQSSLTFNLAYDVGLTLDGSGLWAVSMDVMNPPSSTTITL